MDNYITIELSKDPEIFLVFDEGWHCGECGGHVCLIINRDRACPGCMIKRGGKDEMIIAGWQLSRAGLGQINAHRLKA
jgi:hypothetical protein